MQEDSLFSSPFPAFAVCRFFDDDCSGLCDIKPHGSVCVCVCVCVYFFLVVLGIPGCMHTFSSCSEWGLLFVVVYGLLIAVASLVEHRF